MTIAGLDTSVLIAALLARHEHHARARRSLWAHRQLMDRIVLPQPALIEAFSVLTRLPPAWRLTPNAARDALRASLASHVELVDGAGADRGWGLLDTAVSVGVSGGSIHDLDIALCVVTAGADRIVTFNKRHFARFTGLGLTVVVPE